MIWNPWRKIRELRERIHFVEVELMSAQIDVASARGHADLLADRYEKIRETNAQLRDALALYRNA